MTLKNYLLLALEKYDFSSTKKFTKEDFVEAVIVVRKIKYYKRY